jgi:hypothetical protein
MIAVNTTSFVQEISRFAQYLAGFSRVIGSAGGFWPRATPKMMPSIIATFVVSKKASGGIWSITCRENNCKCAPCAGKRNSPDRRGSSSLPGRLRPRARPATNAASRPSPVRLVRDRAPRDARSPRWPSGGSGFVPPPLGTVRTLYTFTQRLSRGFPQRAGVASGVAAGARLAGSGSPKARASASYWERRNSRPIGASGANASNP